MRGSLAIHDEDDRDEGEEDAVDVYVGEFEPRFITFRSFPFVSSI